MKKYYDASTISDPTSGVQSIGHHFRSLGQSLLLYLGMSHAQEIMIQISHDKAFFLKP